MTAHVSVDYALSALRHQADEFLTKPVDSTQLVEVVRRLAEESRQERRSGRLQSVLAIGAIPTTSRSASAASWRRTTPPGPGSRS